MKAVPRSEDGCLFMSGEPCRVRVLPLQTSFEDGSFRSRRTFKDRSRGFFLRSKGIGYAVSAR